MLIATIQSWSSAEACADLQFTILISRITIHVHCFPQANVVASICAIFAFAGIRALQTSTHTRAVCIFASFLAAALHQNNKLLRSWGLLHPMQAELTILHVPTMTHRRRDIWYSLECMEPHPSLVVGPSDVLL